MTAEGVGFRQDPTKIALFASGGFILEVDIQSNGKPMEIGSFSQIAGLELQVELVPYKEGGQNGFTHHFPGRVSWPNITLSRGITDSDNLFEWVNKTAGPGLEANNNKLQRVTGAITAVDGSGQRLRAWNLVDVIAVQWKGPRFDAKSSELLQEELVIAHHGFTSKTFGVNDTPSWTAKGWG
jgi:phage tail-like protein